MEKKRRRGRSLRCCCFFFRFLRTPLHDATSVESVRRTTKLPGPFIVVVSGRKHNSVEQINAFSQRRLSTFHSVAMAFTGFLWLLPSFTWFFLLSVRVCVYWALRRLPGTGYNLVFKRIIRFVPSFNGFDSVYYLVCFWNGKIFRDIFGFFSSLIWNAFIWFVLLVFFTGFEVGVAEWRGVKIHPSIKPHLRQRRGESRRRLWVYIYIYICEFSLFFSSEWSASSASRSSSSFSRWKLEREREKEKEKEREN